MTKTSLDRHQFETQLATLVAKFERHRAEYLRPAYSEAQVRLDFINPFFEALGWDVRNEAGLGPKERQVVVEQGQTTGRPDYNFRLDGRTVFYVEAKAPHVPLERADVIMQAKSYSWSSRDVFVCAVTDFEEFRLYDATAKPDRRHPDVGLIFAYRYDGYLKPKTLGELWLLSRESVAAGAIEQLLKMSSVTARQKLPVDQAFLDDLTGWREKLAKAVYKAHPGMAVADLNSVVQVFLDRLIFIRIAEDRGILPPRGLEDIARNWEYSGKRRPISPDLNALFHSVNGLLDGEIFKPHPCEKVNWDQSAALVAGIVKGLYFPECPYRFDAIGVELLGSIYERYLGKTIRVTPTRAVVEDKPEVRKAGGVYYTPKYIVDYIVEQTVGKLIVGKTPKQIERLRILDPACGSGSFLLGAYQELLDYHERYYAEQVRKKEGGRRKKGTGQARLIGEGEGGEFKLSLEEKAAILRNNIYGVDIDPQAVEITMMSLYIKMLEGERGAITGRAILPPLRANIKCGNSLIGHDIGRQPDLFGDLSPADLDRINPFDWGSKSEGFGEIMARGGFDVVVGNPPYVRIQTMKEWAPLEVEIYKQQFAAAGSGNYDIYVVFVEKGLSLLNKRGRLGFILPHKFFNSKYGEPLRSLVAEGRHLFQIVHFGDQQIFEGATTYTALLFLDKAGIDKCRFVKVEDIASWLTSGQAVEGMISAASITAAEWNFAVGKGAALFEKLSRMPVKLGDVATRLYQGPITSADTVYLFKEFRAEKRRHITEVFSKELNQWLPIESAVLKTVIRSGSILRYRAVPTALVLFPYEVKNGSARLLPPAEMLRDYPLAWNYLTRNKKLLEGREQGKFKDARWYRFGRTQNLGVWEQPKLMVPYMITELAAYLDQNDNYYFINVTTGGYGITSNETSGSLAYLCGLLNSPLLGFYLKQVSTNFHGGYFAANKQYIEQLPFRPINFSDPPDKARHDRMVALVERMLELHRQKQAAASEARRARIEREIKVTDEAIDALVYELYGLTEEEIKVVEGGSGFPRHPA